MEAPTKSAPVYFRHGCNNGRKWHILFYREAKPARTGYPGEHAYKGETVIAYCGYYARGKAVVFATDEPGEGVCPGCEAGRL